MNRLDQRRAYISFYVMLILAAVGLIAINWANYLAVTSYPSGEYFSITWSAGRAFMREGINPYSADTASRIQRSAVELGYPVDPATHRFAYPIYLFGLILPFLLITDFTAAQVAWMTFLEICLVLLAIFSIRASAWKVSLPVTILVIGFTLLNTISMSQVFQGSIMVLVALLVSLALYAIQRDLDELAGILLAMTLIKPSPVLLLVVFVLFWSISAGRWKVVFWLVGSWLLMAAGGLFFLLDWPLDYLRSVLNSPTEVFYSSPGAALQGVLPGVGRQLGWALSGGSAILLLFEWWAARKKDYRWFSWTACLTLAILPWTGLPTEPGFQVLGLLPLILFWAKLEEHWNTQIRSVVIATMILIFAGLWLLFGWNLPQSLITRNHPGLYLPLPLISIVGLYWIKWWAIRPRRTFISELRARDEF